MEGIVGFFEYFYSMDMTVPASQIMILLLATTLILLFGKVRLALLTNYLFAFYWGYFLNSELFADQLDNGDSIFLVVYFVFGAAVAIMAGIGFLSHAD